MWVKLLSMKHIEVCGKPTTFHPGDWVEVGKQTALRWLARGEAEVDEDDARAQPARAVARVLERRERRPPPPAAGVIGDGPPLTLFAVPMGFQGKHAVKQRNALASWMLLEPRPVVFLFGDEPGIDEAAAEFDCLHLPGLEYNEFGTPIVGDAFHQAQRLAGPLDVLCYVNSDIIVMQDWADALATVAHQFEQFLMIGKRWDVQIDHPLRFDGRWERELRTLVAIQGTRHGPGAIDFFAFRPGLYDAVPPFAIGRSAWDNWLVSHARSLDVPVVDTSNAVTIVHQDKGSTPEIMTPERATEKGRNKAMYEPQKDICGYTGTMRDAQWEMDGGGGIVGRAR